MDDFLDEDLEDTSDSEQDELTILILELYTLVDNSFHREVEELSLKTSSEMKILMNLLIAIRNRKIAPYILELYTLVDNSFHREDEELSLKTSSEMKIAMISLKTIQNVFLNCTVLSLV